MKPLFTIHEGEFLVGDHITRKFSKKYEVWIPAKDSGVDLLVTLKGRDRRSCKLQVKFSRGFDARHKLEGPTIGLARGWYTLKPDKVRNSSADLWIFAILTLRHEKHFVVVPLRELKKRIPKKCPTTWHLFLSVFKGGVCFNTRGMATDQVRDALEKEVDPTRDFTPVFENWKMLDEVAR